LFSHLAHSLSCHLLQDDRLFDARDPNTSPEPLFACDYVYDRYARNDAEIKTLHEKNLYKLGEDRMLTTLLLEKWKRMNLKYIPEAHCYTIVPDKFSVLLSQRRRWINSTFHNTLYLLRVELGGICCFSMKFVVILDMMGTLILPSSLLYICVMAWNTIMNHSQMSTYTLFVLVFSIFVQIISPLLRLKIKYLWYAFIYCE
jgi:chitin synthase